MKWDKGMRVYVVLDPKWMGEVCGLCGNYNNKDSDDMTTRTGGLAETPEEFGDSWSNMLDCAMPEHPLDACETHPERSYWARMSCNIMLQGAFQICNDAVSVLYVDLKYTRDVSLLLKQYVILCSSCRAQ